MNAEACARYIEDPTTGRHVRERASMPLLRRNAIDRSYRRWWHVPLVVIGILLPIIWVILSRALVVSDGTHLLPTPFSSVARIYQVFDDDSPLRPDDEVLAVDGIVVSDWVGGTVRAPDRRIGDLLTYEVQDESGVIRSEAVKLIRYPFIGAVIADGFLLVLVTVTCFVAIFVFFARPYDPAAQAMLVVALALPWGITEFPLGIQVLDLVGGPGVAAYVVGDVAACIFWGALLHLVLVFPEPAGILARRPRLVIGCYALPFILYALSFAWKLPIEQNAIDRLFGVVTVSETAARLIPLLVVIRVIVVYRSTPESDTRRRIRWIMAAFVFGLTSYLSLTQLPAIVIGRPLIGFQWALLAFVPLPLAVAAAILRYRLFDIEVILSRSLLAGTLTMLVVSVYAAVVLLAPTIPQAESLLTLPALLVGGAVAAAALLLRKRFARQITTIVYGQRSDPHAVVERLSRVDTAAEADEVLSEVVGTLAQSLRLIYARLELRSPDGTVESEAQYGSPTSEPTVLPIETTADVLGRLELDAGPGREQFGPADRRLLDDLSRHLAEACRTVLLNRALQRSREHIILGREEERRRLRRDLHDGVGPTLAALSLQLDVAARLVRTDPSAAMDLLKQLASSTRGVVVDVRQIVDGLRPAALDELGLLGAIRQQAQVFDTGVDLSIGLTVSMTGDDDLGELPAAVEVAAYRITIEAITNAARYSKGRHCVVDIRRGPELIIEVTDDGSGLQGTVQGTGVGLNSMHERAAELGGRCIIGPREPPPGTAVRVQLPIQGLGRPL